MSGMSDYALEVGIENPKGRRRNKEDERNNVPSGQRDALMDTKIAECIRTGAVEADTEAQVIAWNAAQPSPMKLGLVKKRVYLAYRAADT